MTEALLYTIDHKKTEVAHQKNDYAWADRRQYTGETHWTQVNPPPHPPPLGAWVETTRPLRAPHRLLSDIPFAAHPQDRWTWHPTWQALELGLVVQWDRANARIYLHSKDAVFVPPDTPLICAEIIRPLAARLEVAVLRLRLAGMPASAEALLDAHVRDFSAAVAGVQREVLAASTKAQTASPLLTWAQVLAVVGDLDG